MLGLVTQTSVYHWSIEGKTFNCFWSHFLPFFWIYFNDFCTVLLSPCGYFFIYHSWCIWFLGDSEPLKMFERTANLANNQIINYRCDPTEKWLILIGIAPGSPEVSSPTLSVVYGMYYQCYCLYVCFCFCILHSFCLC